MPKKIELTAGRKQGAFLLLWGRATGAPDGVLPHGSFTKVARMFGVQGVTISRLWRETLAKLEEEAPGDTEQQEILISTSELFQGQQSARGRKPK